MADLKCIPEWCSQDPGGAHGDVCPESPMPIMTKAEFVGFLESAAEHAIEDYQYFMDNEDFDSSEAFGVARDAVSESAFCYAGIGSCGRGWCNHS